MEEPINNQTKYQKCKPSIMKWRATHKQEFYEMNLPHLKRWREKNRETFNEKMKNHQRKYDTWKRIQKIYLHILL
jgi:hypothetical protein